MANPPSPPRAEPMEEDFTTGWIASFSPSKCSSTVYYCVNIKTYITSYW